MIERQGVSMHYDLGASRVQVLKQIDVFVAARYEILGRRRGTPNRGLGATCLRRQLCIPSAHLLRSGA